MTKNFLYGSLKVARCRTVMIFCCVYSVRRYLSGTNHAAQNKASWISEKDRAVCAPLVRLIGSAITG